MLQTPSQNRNLRTFWRSLSQWDRIGVVLLFIGASLQIVSMLALPPEGDAPNHIYRIGMLHSLWQHGEYYPRWLPECFSGYGSPAFYFYPPLAYFAAGVLGTLAPSFSAVGIFKLTCFFFSLLSFVTFWVFLKSKGSIGWRATFGAVLYAFAPYRYLDTNVRGALAEHAAFVWFPFILWGIDQIYHETKSARYGLIAAAIGWAGVLATNIPASVVVLCGIVVFWISMHSRDNLRRSWLVLASLAVGSLLAATSVLPAIQFGSSIDQTMFAQTSYRFGESNTPLLDIFSGRNITINLFGVLSAVSAIFLLITMCRKKKTEIDKPFPANSVRIIGALRWVVLLVLVVQIPFLSGLLFKYFPPAILVQFPWRFDMLLVPIVALLWARPTDSRKSRAVSYIVAVWMIISIPLMFAKASGVSVQHHIEDPAISTWEYIVPRWAHSTAQPIDTSMKQYADQPEAISDNLGKDESILVSKRQDYADSLSTDFHVTHMIVFHRFFWPEWSIRVDGQPVPVTADSIGRLAALIPPGIHKTVVQLRKSTSEYAGEWTSLLTAIVLLLSLIVIKGSRRETVVSPQE